MAQARVHITINDAVHGHMSVHPICKRVIDTPEFQRLRDIKQTGFAFWVYPSASHTRFEHSIGVMHLAQKMIDKLRETNGADIIDNTDSLCIQLAALCHDIGHGPFSHTWTEVLKALGKDWQHEDHSCKIVRQIFKDEKLKTDAEFEDTHIDFICNMILGNKSDDRKPYFFEIVNNKSTGVDVDKWDYLMRDRKYLNIMTGFDPHRLLVNCRVCKVPTDNDSRHIAYRDKTANSIYAMYSARSQEHSRACQHPATKHIEEMFIDAMVEANKGEYTINGRRLCEAHEDLDTFLQMTDKIFYDVLHTTGKDLLGARNLLQRIQRRRLYKIIYRGRINHPTEDFVRDLTEELQNQNQLGIPITDFLKISEIKMSFAKSPETSPFEKMYFFSKKNTKEAKPRDNFEDVPVYFIPWNRLWRRECLVLYKSDGNLTLDQEKLIKDTCRGYKERKDREARAMNIGH